MAVKRGIQMTRRLRVAASVVAALIATAAMATPAIAAEQTATETFNPVKKTRRALIFEPRSVPADAVVAASVELQKPNAGSPTFKPVSVDKVRRAIERRARLRVKRARKARGELELEIGLPAGGGDGPSSEEPPVMPPAPSVAPSEWRRSASFESSLNAGTDHGGWRIDSPFSVTRTTEAGAADGSYASKIVTNGGGGGCSCPRMKFQDGFAYGPGEDLWMSGAWRIPDPTEVDSSRLMNLGHYENDDGDWLLALESSGTPGSFQVSFAPYSTGRRTVILPPRPIPVDRWFRVDLHFVLSPTNGQALTEWFIDGELVGQTTKANMYSSEPLHFFNGRAAVLLSRQRQHHRLLRRPAADVGLAQWPAPGP